MRVSRKVKRTSKKKMIAVSYDKKAMSLIDKMNNWQRQQYHRYIATGAQPTMERVTHYSTLRKPA
jgi:hypothetical protein